MPVARPAILNKLKPPEDRGVPITLAAEAIVAPGEFSTLNTDALRNNTASPIEIREIRFGGFLTDPNLVLLPLGAGFADVDLKIDGVKLMNNPVSVALLDRTEGNGWYYSTAVGGVGAMAISRYKLARPIILMPGQGIEPSLYHRSVAPSPLALRVAFAGRALSSPPPERRWLPYIASFQKTVTIDGSGTAANVTIVTSTEKDLLNASGKTVRVERIAGRLYRFVASGSNTILQEARISADGDFFANTKVRLTDSRGFNYAFDTPMPSIFDPARRNWECPNNMPPNSYIISETTIPSLAGATSAQVAYAIVGYREI